MITACIITFKRPQNVAPIVTHLISQPFIETVMVRDMEARNTRAFGRYELAQHAPTEEIFTQDDDCIVRDIAAIYELYRADPERIAFGLHPSHYPIWSSFTYGDAQLAMMGWGAFFRKEWIAPAFERYWQRYEHDAFFEREADRIFSLLTKNTHHNPLLTPNLEHLPGCKEGAAMCIEDEHFKSRDIAIERCLRIVRRR